jgi:low affinity Fe/Cu permease
VLGVAGGEAIATRAFGFFKKPWMYIAEIVMFVIGIVIIFNFFSFTSLDAVLFVLTYFVLGLIVIIVARGIMTGAGILAEHVKENILKVRDERDYLIGLKKALERRGFESEEIVKIAKEVGYKPDLVDDVLVFFGYKKADKPKKTVKKQRKRKG